jgi:hypothetical protein
MKAMYAVHVLAVWQHDVFSGVGYVDFFAVCLLLSELFFHWPPGTNPCC